MFNRVILIGNLTKDPEVRYTPGGTPVATVPIAVNSKHKDKGGDMKEETLYMDCVVFGKQAETCAQYLAKGRQVLVEGRLRQRRWEHEGQKHYRMEVVANTVRFLGSKGQAAGSADPRAGDADRDLGHAPDEVSDVEPF
jgi:single-strand DNA-binding protein